MKLKLTPRQPLIISGNARLCIIDFVTQCTNISHNFHLLKSSVQDAPVEQYCSTFHILNLYRFDVARVLRHGEGTMKFMSEKMAGNMNVFQLFRSGDIFLVFLLLVKRRKFHVYIIRYETNYCVRDDFS